MKKSDNILIISTMPFPSGNASVNRIMTYAKGLAECGENVDVATTHAGECQWQELDGFRFKALSKNRSGKLGRLVRLGISAVSLLNLVLWGKKKYGILILASNSLFIIYLLAFATRLKGLKLLQEKSEFPFVLNNRSFIGKLYSKYYINTTYRLFDGLIIMTNPLMDFFRDKVKKKCQLFLMPMTVDLDRFKGLARNSKENYIGYCGDIGGNKDGVENLISSFNLIKDKYPDWKLLIIGGSSHAEEQKIHKLASELKIPNLVFYGRAPREDMPQLLTNAKILVLARPSSLQSTGGFPTKLGEYLATANPVIATKVGEIPHYLINNKTAFLVDPDNIESFAQRMEYVIDNYDKAKVVGAEGKKLALTVFNYKFQSEKLQNFIKTKL